MSNAGPLDQQDEYQSLESANSAYSAAEAADAVGDTAGAAGYMDVAQKQLTERYLLASITGHCCH